jgi:peroxiredoxin
MALTPSTMTPLGSAAPDFRLPNTNGGGTVALGDLVAYDALLVMFLCNHCPFVVHVNPELIRLANDYAARSLAIVAISSNDVLSHPQDGPDPMAQRARELGYPFPYLFDESQDVARAYGAACTPDFFLYDRDRRLVYRGQLDDSRPGNAHPLDGSSLRAAIDALLAGKPVPEPQRPSVGCNIKWRG